jgi:hypothetical protein
VPVELEERLSWLLADHAEWMRLTDLFDPGSRGPLREVELTDTGHAVLPAPRPVPEDEAGWAIPGVTGLDTAATPVVPRVSDLVASFVALSEHVAAVEPSELDAALALGDAQALVEVTHTIRGTLMRRSQDVNERRLFEHLGYRSLPAWQRDTAPDTPRSERTLSRRLGALPHLRAALTEQRVSFTAANQVGKTIADLSTHLDRQDGLIDQLPGDEVLAGMCAGVLELIAQHHGGLSSDDPKQAALLASLDERLGAIALSPTSQLDRAEQLLVLVATELPADRLGGALEQITLQLLPSRLERQEREAQRQRSLRLKPNPDRTWDLRATLTPEVGEQLFTALAAEARRDPANPVDTHARAALRDAARDPEAYAEALAAQAAVDTTAAQAASDAAAAGSEHSLDDVGRFDEAESGLLTETDPWDARPLSSSVDAGEAPSPRTRGQRLHDAAGRMLSRYLAQGLGGTSNKIPVQVSALISERTIVGAPGAPPARGGSGRPLAASLVRRWWCDANVTALLMSDGMIPLGLVHQQRTLTAVETKAITAQFGQRCPGIGCCSGEPDPLTPLIPHHIEMFSTNGQTSLGLTAWICEVLHQDIHLGKKTVRLRDGRLLDENGFLPQPG